MITIKGDGFAIKRTCITTKTINNIIKDLNGPASAYYAYIEKKDSDTNNIIIYVKTRETDIKTKRGGKNNG